MAETDDLALLGIERDVKALAVGALQEWFVGYTVPSGFDGEQRKVVHHEYTDDGVVVEVRVGPNFEPSPQRYRFAVTVEKVLPNAVSTRDRGEA